MCVDSVGRWGSKRVGAGCRWTLLVRQYGGGRLLQDAWNAAETEGRALIGAATESERRRGKGSFL